MGDARGTLLGANVDDDEVRDLTSAGNPRPSKLEPIDLDTTIWFVLALAPVACAERRGHFEREAQAMASVVASGNNA